MRPNTSIRILLAAAFILALVTVAWPTTSAVNVRFLGTGTPDFVVEKARMQAGILVDVEGERWLLDAGAGVMARLFDTRVDPASLNNVFISHLHYDHCLDLDAILLAWLTAGPVIGTPNRLRDRTPLHLWGPDQIEKLLSGLYDDAYGQDGRGRQLLKIPLFVRTRNREAGAVKTAKTEASFREVKHVPGMDCWAIRLRTPRGVIVYSGDIGNDHPPLAISYATGNPAPAPAGGPGAPKSYPFAATYEAQADFAEWARGADMLILDTLHLSPEVLAKIVATAAPKTVVFSHMADRAIPIFPRYDAKRAAELAGKTGVKVVVATEGMALSL